jgi:hypothetical protein
VSFAAVTLCVASQRVFIVVSIYFVIDSVRKLLDTPSYAPYCQNRLSSVTFRSNRGLLLASVANPECGFPALEALGPASPLPILTIFWMTVSAPSAPELLSRSCSPRGIDLRSNYTAVPDDRFHFAELRVFYDT